MIEDEEEKLAQARLSFPSSTSSVNISQLSTHPLSSSQRQLKKMKTRGSVQADLSHVRKQFEKASLAEIISRQKFQSSNPNPDPNFQYISTNSPSSTTNNNNNKSNVFTINLQMISELLSHRQATISHLNDKLFSLFDAKSKDLNTRADDEIWRKTLRISISNANGNFMQPIGPILGLLNHPSHPISQISRDFVLRLKHLSSETEDCEKISKQISEEYHQFSFQMIKLLRHNYEEELANDSLILALNISIETYIFSNLPGLSTGIHEIFSKANSEEDSFLLNHLTNLTWLNFDHQDALYTVLGVPEKYRLSAVKYEPAINEFRYAASLKCPTAKALAAVKVCDLICSAVDDHLVTVNPKQNQSDTCENNNKNHQIKEDSSIGSEDLVLLLSWVIVQAQVPNLATFFSIVSEFLPEELIRGQAGYVLATIQTCLDFIKNI